MSYSAFILRILGVIALSVAAAAASVSAESNKAKEGLQ